MSTEAVLLRSGITETPINTDNTNEDSGSDLKKNKF
jgi:hypothetical protein